MRRSLTVLCAVMSTTCVAADGGIYSIQELKDSAGKCTHTVMSDGSTSSHGKSTVVGVSSSAAVAVAGSVDEVQLKVVEHVGQVSNLVEVGSGRSSLL